MDPTPSINPMVLFTALRLQVPWPPNPAQSLMEHVADEDALRTYCLPVLLHLSKMPREQALTNALAALPLPETPEFPALALGLLELLDQGPRILFKGINRRYVYGHFDLITREVLRHLDQLPDHLRPELKTRWLALGYSHDDWIILRLWFLVCLAHSEDVADHELLGRLGQDIRRTLKAGPKALSNDELLERSRALRGDFEAFRSLVTAGRPSGPKVTVAEFVVWYLDVFDAHAPFLNTFGRYPYRNSALGRRPLTDDEDRLAIEYGFLERLSPQEAKQVEEDVLAGRWTPLSVPVNAP